MSIEIPTETNELITKVVVTGIIRDLQDRIFIQQRPVGKQFQLMWEIPGGKVEQYETCERALIRELNEELKLEYSRVYANQFLGAVVNNDLKDNEPILLLFYEVRHTYIEAELDLLFSRSKQKWAWLESRKDISKYNFIPSDELFLKSDRIQLP